MTERLSGNACHTRSRARRSLHGDHREVATRLELQLRRALVAQSLQPREVLVGGAGIDDQAEPIFRKEVDDQVVEHPAVLLQQARVERLSPHFQLVDIVRQRVAQEIARARPAQIDREHVRNIEHARIAAHSVVLVDLRTVADGHVPPAEIDHLGAGRAMNGVEGGFLEHCVSQVAKQKGRRHVSASPHLSFYLRDCGARVVSTRVRCPFGGPPGVRRAAALQIVCCSPRSPFA